MRLLDPLTGIRLAYGNWTIHAGYFITILLLPQEAECSWRFSSCKTILLVSHALEIVLSAVGFFLKKHGFTFFSHFSESFAMFIYHGAIFWAQT